METVKDIKKFAMKSHTWHQKGFTLIEIIMVIVLLGIIGVITFQVLFSGVETFVKAKERKELYDQGRLALERMVREIRVATQISFPAQGNSGNRVDFIKEAYSYATGAPLDSSTDLRFQRQATNLVRTGDVSGNAVLASSVSNFTVTHEMDNFVTLEISLNSPNGGTVSMQTRVYPRNLP